MSVFTIFRADCVLQPSYRNGQRWANKKVNINNKINIINHQILCKIVDTTFDKMPLFLHVFLKE